MRILSFRSAAALLAASVGLAGCAYSPYGSGVGVGVGYGDPYYGGYGSYGSPYGYGSRYGGYGYSPYYGWNNGYYYPGTGYYVYDRYRNPYYWSEAQRRYWEEQMRRHREQNRGEVQANWRDFIRGEVVDVNDIRIRRPDGSTVSGTQQQVTSQRVQSDGDVRRQSLREAIREASERRRAQASTSEPKEERRTWRRRPQD